MASTRYQNLDALRGIAATIVMMQHLLGHVWRSMPEQTGWLKAIGVDYFDWGRFGVVLFFLISGYVIPFSFSGPTPLRKFIVSRIFRLYPAYWLSAIVVTCLLYVSDESVPYRQVLANLTMAYPLFREPALTGVYWTLIIELGFYVISTALFIIGALQRPFAVTAVALIAIASTTVPMAANAYGSSFHVSLFGYHLSFLFLGSLIRLSLNGVSGGTALSVIVGMTIALTLPLVTGLATGQATNYSLATPVGAILSVAVALAVFLIFWTKRFQAQPSWIVALGSWSYSIYLFHEPLASAASWFVRPDDAVRAIVFVTMVSGATILISAVAYHLVEKPMIEAGRKIVAGRPRATAVDFTP